MDSPSNLDAGHTGTFDVISDRMNGYQLSLGYPMTGATHKDKDSPFRLTGIIQRVYSGVQILPTRKLLFKYIMTRKMKEGRILFLVMDSPR
jgi:hypothetical protein